MNRRAPNVWLALVLTVVGSAAATDRPPKAAIASGHALATAAGFETLSKGGNAFDAAVSVSAALAVVEPSGSGLGGGGFFLLRQTEPNRSIVIDARERAPLAAQRDMYVGADGKPVRERATDGPLSAGIPGLPAALAHLAARYGRIPLSASLAPAIALAEKGFELGQRDVRLLAMRRSALQKSPAASAIFLTASAAVPAAGARLKQPELAETLRALAQRGATGFYAGPVAKRLIDGIRAAGGIWTHEDLQSYRVVEREPLHGRYRTVSITVPPPPSSGGVVLLESLHMLEPLGIEHLPATTRRHAIIEAWRRAYRDRDRHLGDPDFITMPIRRLLSLDYAEGLRSTLRLDRATPSGVFEGAPEPAVEADNTTHFSILDRQGNAVAATLSINLPFGSGFVPPGTGVLLNDEMDDFAVQPGTANAYRLVGGEPNAVAPGKRMLSSMTPSFVDDGTRFGILGTPGGSRIISMVMLGVLDFAAGNGPQSWVAAKRFHHQYLPDIVEFEPDGLSSAERAELERFGHRLKATGYAYGDMHAVMWDRAANRVEAASDPRGDGAAQVVE